MINTQFPSPGEELIGIPFRHGGRSLEGLDCLGLVWLFYQKYGILIPDSDGAEYLSGWYKKDPERLWRNLSKLGQAVAPDELQPLDLVFFRLGHAINHLGVIVDDGLYFLHVLKGESVKKTFLDSRWRKRLAGGRRLLFTATPSRFNPRFG